MKFSHAIAVLALLGSVDARHRHHRHPRADLVGLNVQQGTQNRRRLLQIDSDADQWDTSMSKFMDADSYVKEVKNSLMEDEEPAPK